MKPVADSLNARLCRLLSLTVRDSGTFAPDGTWLKTFVRDAAGNATPPPDFERDLAATTRRLPALDTSGLGIELRLKYCPQTREWRALLCRGYDLFEAFGETDALAAAKALEQMLVLDRARETA